MRTGSSQSARLKNWPLRYPPRATDFQQQQTSYDAALKSYSAVQRLSLFQYLNL